METLNILVVGTHQPIIRTIGRLIEKEGKWKAHLAYTLNEASSICEENEIALTLIGAGLTASEEEELSLSLNRINSAMPIVKHYGGGSGLLFAEIYQALASQQ